jgi:hypothetical protein
MMHANSREAYQTLDVGRRQAIVRGAYAGHGAMTDRQLCAVLGFSDMNAVRPRITELVIAGQLIECGKVRDTETGRKVRVCRLAPKQLEMQL